MADYIPVKLQACAAVFVRVICVKQNYIGIILLNHFDIQATSWDYQETKIGGPFEKILEHDIMINAALILNKIPPFIDDQ